MAYGKVKVIVNAGGMTKAQADLILKLADKHAWDLHASSKMREWFAMHIGDIESNPASSPLTGGWNGTASAFITELKKVVERKDVSKFVRPDGIEIAIPAEKRYLPAGVTSEEANLIDPDGIPDVVNHETGETADEIDPWAETADANDLQILRDAIAVHPNELHAGEKKLVGPGVYVYDGAFFAVKESTKNPGRHYAYLIRLVDGKFKHSYAKGVIYRLTEEMRASADVVVAMNKDTVRTVNGRRVGSCCVCGRMLTKKASIDAGIGPVCGGRVGL